MWMLFPRRTAISFALTIIAVGANGPCDHSINTTVDRICGCNYAPGKMLPDDKMIGSFFFPVMYTVILKGVKWEAVILALVLNVFAVFFPFKKYQLPLSMA